MNISWEKINKGFINSRKSLLAIYLFIYMDIIPYLDTNTSKQVENTKAFEWSIIKELGKLTHVTSG